MALRLDILANTRQLVSEMKKAGTSVDDVSDSLDDIVKGGDNAGEKLERSFKDLAREAKKADDAVENVGKSGQRAGKSVDSGIDRAKRSMDDFKDEADSTAKEAAASFDGSAESVGDAFQELAANLGPAGVVGAVVIGSIIALATSAVENWEEKVQGIKDATSEMWQAAAEEGRSFIDSTSITAEAYRLLWDKAYEDQFAAAERAGISRSDLALALAEGEGDAYDRVKDRIVQAFKEQAEASAVYSDTAKEGGDKARVAAEKEAAALGPTVALLEEKAKAVEANKKLTREAQEVTATAEKAQRDQIKKTNDAAQSRYEGLAQLYSRPITGTVRIVPDDSAIRSYRPPMLYVPWKLQSSPSGRQPL